MTKQLIDRNHDLDQGREVRRGDWTIRGADEEPLKASGPAVGAGAGHLLADARARARQSEQVPVRAAVWVGT